ncbi:glycoside hydrolase superfamily [Radiomyces spectabilis]|uniref:glycoside hydrolase superfamily n=1 Tax=Radiomyces spectabilis TaxID=64574 RepID=UPI00222058AD|nr:glycoside hydrolase superfamily [Radiomyces spectabilis]KAI8381025.1 glycoside hydrolase superfamily [Radiomyces spectabilis]
MYLLSRAIFTFVACSSIAISSISAFTPLSWDQAYVKADMLVGQMSLEQKVNLTTGVGWSNGPCVGNSGRSVNPNFPELCLQDAPLGIRFADLVSSGVAGINAAASFDKAAIRRRGEYMGKEFRAKGINVQLGPGMNMARTAAGGRNWEGFGEDPYLAGIASAETIQGIQSEGVMATAKHIIGNEQETNRNEASSDIDDRTMHEIYLWPFARSVEAGVASVMCSYNKVNGVYACESEYVLNQLLKGELGFKGFVQSDWSATHSTSPSVNGGLDMTMPGDVKFGSGTSYFGSTLVDAVRRGEVTEARVTDMATRIVAAWYKLGQDQNFPPVNFDSFHPDRGQHIDVQDNHKELIREMGAASTVLLRNKNNILPLQPSKLRRLAVIGEDADMNPSDLNSCPDHGCDKGTLAQGWGSGTAEFPYLITPLQGLQDALPDSVTIDASADNDIGKATQTAKGADIAIVFANSDSGEEYITVEGNKGDRNDISLWHNGDSLVEAVANANKNTIVVIHSVGPITMPWINHPNIQAIVWPGLPGQESGNALADVLLGKVNPSGRLPYTIAKNVNDYPASVSKDMNIPYKEGLLIGHRWFDANGIQPLFEFGYGMSYTKFNYDKIAVEIDPTHVGVKVSVMVQNTGNMDGAEVVQAYLGFPEDADEPPKVLRGFEKINLKKGAPAEPVTFRFGPTELSYWDTDKQRWVIPVGQFTVYVGASSRDIRQAANFTIP